MNPRLLDALGVAGAVALLVAAGGRFGWQGVVAGVTLGVFGLLLQWSRTMRLLRRAAQAPVGTARSAVMLHAALRRGQRLADVIGRAGSLGRRVDPDVAAAVSAVQAPGADREGWSWRDAGGDTVVATFERGRLARWRLERATPSDGVDA